MIGFLRRRQCARETFKMDGQPKTLTFTQHQWIRVPVTETVPGSCLLSSKLTLSIMARNIRRRTIISHASTRDFAQGGTRSAPMAQFTRFTLCSTCGGGPPIACSTTRRLEHQLKKMHPRIFVPRADRAECIQSQPSRCPAKTLQEATGFPLSETVSKTCKPVSSVFSEFYEMVQQWSTMSSWISKRSLSNNWVRRSYCTLITSTRVTSSIRAFEVEFVEWWRKGRSDVGQGIE